MIYVALLRGINVGGNNKIAMVDLRKLCEQLEFEHVTSYINSGNVVFSYRSTDTLALASQLELAIHQTFGLHIPVLVCDLPTMQAIAVDLPDSWQNNGDSKCDVMFLWQKYADSRVLHELVKKPGIDEVVYSHGALLWRVDRALVTKSGMLRLVGTDLYKHMTIRNCNTFRKLVTLMTDPQQ